MTARWIPDDAELDAVARTLEPHEPSGERGEQNRTAVLAGAAAQVVRPRRSVAPYALVGTALAAAAAVAIWLGMRPAEAPHVTAPSVAAPTMAAPKQTIAPLPVARFERVTDWPDFVVRLDDGKLAVQVAALDASERFRIKTADAEVEARDTRFEVAADQGRVTSVAVQQGRVELRVVDQQVVILAAGESWTAPRTAERETIRPDGPRASGVGRPVETSKLAPQPERRAANPERRNTTADVRSPEPDARRPTSDVAPLPRPGEAEFRAGMAALRGGDARAAASSFATACTNAQRDALGEDACFWAGAAAKRAGDTAGARAALARFLQQFASSARAPEAAALLGWILYDSGELDAAEQLFHQADHDRVPQVSDSARRGLEAIARKRTR